MFLRPHHFQAADRYAARALAQNVRMARWHSWGFRRCVIDPDALAGFRLVVRALEARFPDGTTLTLPDDAPAPSVDLKPAFADRAELPVFLAVPQWRVGQPNLHTPAATTPARYHAAPVAVDDENTGGNQQPVPFRAPAVRVLLGDEDRSGYEVLPLCRLQKSEEQGTPRLDAQFIPPVLVCDAWPCLQDDILQNTFYRLDSKIEALAAQVAARGMSFDSHTPGDAGRMNQLARMNEGHAVLSHVAFAPGVHPEAAYVELCRLVGQLAVFGPGARAKELPRYDHDDLGACFWALKERIDDLLAGIKDAGHKERPFVRVGNRMQVALEPEWLEAGWQMFVGVRASVTAEECVRVLTRPEKLGMKIGSSSRVDQIFTKGQPGLGVTPAPQPPAALPPPVVGAPSLSYYKVFRESVTNEWSYVVGDKTLAIRVKEGDGGTGTNAGNADGQRVLTVQSAGQTNTYEFTLFLVPAAK
jgi:type VI secretion system protein ImpJ